jgi:multiple antibiotic resistance protein
LRARWSEVTISERDNLDTFMTADLRQIVEGVLLVFAALFPIVNPLGGAPIFLAMTSDYAPEERDSLAWRVTVNAFILLVASVATGT